jgi:WD40 repeat protein
MMPTEPSRDQRFHAVLAAYLAAVEACQPPDPDALLAQHPDLAAELRSFFADEAYLAAVEGGQSPDRDALLAQHPDLAAELRSFFDKQDRRPQDQPPHPPAGIQPPTTPELPNAVPEPLRDFGDYQLLEEIGRGGMGVVYKAYQRSLRRHVAVKTILAGQLAGPEEVERFRREAQAVAQLDHPHIVPIYEIGRHQGQHYFSMKLIDGHSLSHDLAHYRRHHKAAAFLVARVARAIHFAHRRGILHRDLKPGNILLDARKQPHVTDFGLAKRLDASGSLSPEGAVIGTPSYMAPEQAAGQSRELSPPADVYSLGAILYEMLTGQPPFRAETPLETLMQVLEREPLPPQQLNPKIDCDLETICLKCLDKRPQCRYASAEDLAEDLASWVEGKPIRARRVRLAERLWLWCRRKPVLAALSVAAALLLLLVIGLVPISLISASRKAEADAAKAVADEEARKAAEKARREEDKKRHKEYLGDMRVANLAWRGKDYAQVRRLLEKYRPATREESDFRSWEWYLFDAASRGHLATLRDRGSLGGLWWSPDGQRLAWSEGNSLRIWDAAAGQELPALSATVDTWTPPPWAPDSRRLATFGNGGVLVWDTTNGKMLFSLAAGWFAWSPDGRLLATTAGNPHFPGKLPNKDAVRLLDGATGTEKLALADSEGANRVRWSADGRRLAAFSNEWLKVWDIDQGKERLFALPRPSGSAWFDAYWSPDGKRLAVLDNHQSPPAGKFTFVDAVAGTVLVTSPVIEGFQTLTWSPDGQRLAIVMAGSFGVRTPYGPHIVLVLDAATGGEVFKLQFETQSVGWSSDGQRLLIQLPEAREVLAWNGTSGEKVAAEEGDGNALTGANVLPFTQNPLQAGDQRYSPDGRRLVVAEAGPAGSGFPFDRTSRLLSFWDVSRGRRSDPYRYWLSIFPSLPRTALQSQWFESPDGKLIAVAQDGTVREAWTGRIVHVPGGISKLVSGAAFSPDSRWLVTKHPGKLPSVRVWSTTTGKELVSLPGVVDLYWVPDSSRFAFVDGADIKVWDPNRGKEVQSLRGAGGEAPQIGSAFRPVMFWGPEGKMLLVKYFDSGGERKYVWDIASGKRLHSLTHPNSHIGVEVSWSPDGRRIVGEDSGGLYWTWDLAANKLTENRNTELLALQTRLRSPDGQKWAAVDKDQRLLVWDRLTGRKSYPMKYSEQVSLHWSPDGRFLAVSEVPTRNADMWKLRLQDTTSNREPVTITSKHRLQPVAWDARGDRLIIMEDRSLKGLESATGKQLFTVPLSGPLYQLSGPLYQHGHTSFPYVWWSPDGRYLLAVLLIAQGQPPQQAAVPRGRPSPRGPAYDYVSACYDLKANKELFKEPLGNPTGSPAHVQPAEWSPDGRFVVIKQWFLVKPDILAMMSALVFKVAD